MAFGLETSSVKMKQERFNDILKIIEEKKYVRVEELSQALFVSMPTIRRDLNELQQMNLIVRNHGGAMRKDTDLEGSPFAFRARANASAKKQLAKAAATLVRDNSVIFIDESTTTMHLIDLLDGFRNIKIITNSISAMTALGRTSIETFCLSGRLNKDNMSIIGSFAEASVEQFGIDLMFFSSSGLRSDGMIVDYDEGSNALRKHALQCAEKKIFLCDRTKYGKNSAFALTHVSNMDYLVLEPTLPPEIDTGNAEILYI